MKFKGEPNLFVKINKPHHGEVKHFSFDDNGYYETEHPITIKRLQASFCEVKKENSVTDDKPTETKHCKKCNFTCDNQGQLLAHYREMHPKEG